MSTKKVIDNLKKKIDQRKQLIESKRDVYNQYLYLQALKQVADSIMPDTKETLKYKFNLWNKIMLQVL